MYFKRSLISDLIKWRDSVERKPLVLMGARQVGKTTLLKYFGGEVCEHIVYINFELESEAGLLFERSLLPDAIIDNLSLFTGRTISAENTLIIFDEVQECRRALTSLKYFCELAPEYCIIAAGSLLGLSLGHEASFPVGKVDFMRMYPLSFEEYIGAGDKTLLDIYYRFLLSEKIENVPDPFFNLLMSAFKKYLFSGGMPEVAMIVQKQNDFSKATEVHNHILDAYRIDFAKHADEKTAVKINYLWNSIPSQLAKENKKFLYNAVKSGARAREYEEALLWLEQAGLISKIHRATKPAIPLRAYIDVSAFKIYLFDTGLLGAMAKLNPQVIIYGNRLFTEFKGALTENYICQCMQLHNKDLPIYWKSERSAEIDFLMEYKTHIIPIEVKSDITVRSKSLAYYKNAYNPKLRLRFSAQNLTLDDDLLNIPLFYADQFKVFLNRILS